MDTITTDVVTHQCIVSYCDRTPRVRGRFVGYCPGHAQQVRKNYPIQPLKGQRTCKFSGCGVPIGMVSGNWCPTHKVMCKVPGCAKPRAANGMYCPGHAYRNTTHGHPLKTVNRSPGTGTDWYLNRYGYLVRNPALQPDGKRPQIAQHREVMEQVLGRTLFPGETVHHINGVKTDNRPENLELWTTRQPPGQRVSDLLADAHRILDLYGDM